MDRRGKRKLDESRTEAPTRHSKRKVTDNPKNDEGSATMATVETGTERSPVNKDLDEPQVEGYIKVELDPEVEVNLGIAENQQQQLSDEHSSNTHVFADPDIDIGDVDVKVFQYTDDQPILQEEDESEIGSNVINEGEVEVRQNPKVGDVHLRISIASCSKSSEKKDHTSQEQADRYPQLSGAFIAFQGPAGRMQGVMSQAPEHNLSNSKPTIDGLRNIEDTPMNVLEQIEQGISAQGNKFEYCIIGCRSVRVGSYKVTDNDTGPLKVTITAIGISFTLPYCHSKNRKIKLCIPRNNMLGIHANLTKRLPVIFLKTGLNFAKWVRDVLGMDGSPDNHYTYYYCPEKGSNCQRTITILPEFFSEADVGLLRKMYSDTLTEIDYELANRFLMDITPETYKTTVNYQLDLESPAASVSTPGSKNIGACSFSTVVPSSQINDATGDRSSANFSKIFYFFGCEKTQSLGTTSAASVDYDQELTIQINEGKDTRIPISPKDISCLGHSQFINDQIIYFWLSVINTEFLSEKDRGRTFVYDNFFYSRLTKGKERATEDGTLLTGSEGRHALVKNWTKHVDIFAKDFLIIPINEKYHWFVAIICFPGMQGYHDYETLEPLPNYSVSKGYAETRVQHPCIFLFDSLAGDPSSEIYSILREYLRIEYKFKKGVDRAFDNSNFPGLMPKVPQQSNFGFDGGLFMLQYIESFFSHPLLTYDIRGIHLNSWFEPQLAENKRKVIYDFIKKKIEEQCPHHLACVPDVNFDPDECDVYVEGDVLLRSFFSSLDEENNEY